MKRVLHHRQIIWSAIASTIILLLLLVVTLQTLMFFNKAQTHQAGEAEEPERVTICQLNSDPAKYNQKLVKLTAFFSHGFEDSGVYDPECRSRFGVWYEYGGTNVTGTMYCCGVTAARTRPEQVSVEGISIPLLVDNTFQTFDSLLHSPPIADNIVRATVIGRYFSGEKGKAADGSVWWGGYGHLGCCSLFMIQQVVHVDSHDRKDLDYRASADQPEIEKDGCGYKYLMELDPVKSLIEAQREADSTGPTWVFEDPMRVAVKTFAKLLHRDPSSIKGLRLKRSAQGRQVYDWSPKKERATYMVVISRPYALSFYAKTDRVAWVPIAAYRSSCGDDNNVTEFTLPKP